MKDKGLSALTLWAGFSGNRPHVESMDDHWGGKNERQVPALFLTREEARQQFQDVRKVRIVWEAHPNG